MTAFALTTGCATTLEAEARRASAEGIDPDPLLATLAGAYAAIDATKRIFDVTLIEGGRRFAGEGAVDYQADPRRLQADVYGPQSTPIVHVRLIGDSLTVTLPQEGQMLTGELGDPRFAELTGERALVSPEVLGALLGAYDVERMAAEADWLAAAADGDERTLYIGTGGAIQALTVSGQEATLTEYRQSRDGRLVYRVRFEDYELVDGRRSPRHVVLRDFIKDRLLVIDVSLERAGGGG